jgi:hypothetical protein
MSERLESHYFPGIASLALLCRADRVCLDAWEHFEKQTYRNRCRILAPNGVQSLTVPVEGRNTRQRMKDVRISYREPWQRVHRNAIQTAYRSAPFYEYMDRELEMIFSAKHLFLMDLNEAVLEMLLSRLKIKKEIVRSRSYELDAGEADFRGIFHPKRTETGRFIPYSQVFSERYPFVPDLSALDLLMNNLPQAKEYLACVETALPVR